MAADEISTASYSGWIGCRDTVDAPESHDSGLTKKYRHVEGAAVELIDGFHIGTQSQQALHPTFACTGARHRDGVRYERCLAEAVSDFEVGTDAEKHRHRTRCGSDVQR